GFTQENNVLQRAVTELTNEDYSVCNHHNSGAIYKHVDERITFSNTTYRNLPIYACDDYTGAGQKQLLQLNLSLGNNTFTDVGKGQLGWGDGRTTHYPNN